MIRIEKNALVYEYNCELVKIEPWGKNALRIRCSPDGRLSGKNRALLDLVTDGGQAEADGDCGKITNGLATAEINKDGKITIYSCGKRVLEEALRLQPLKRPARYFKPRLCGAVPQHTGTIVHSQVPFLRTALSCSSEGISPSRYIMVRSSSNSQIFSISSS